MGLKFLHHYPFDPCKPKVDGTNHFFSTSEEPPGDIK
jgi:hypothetical protein